MGSFDCLDCPFDYLAADEIAEISLPKSPKATGAVDQGFKAEISPQSK
jgi:hypothetical protein